MHAVLTRARCRTRLAGRVRHPAPVHGSVDGDGIVVPWQRGKTAARWRRGWPTRRGRGSTGSTIDQREQAAWPFPADDERRLWFYTPTDHGGLPLGAMDAAQQQAAMRLLRAGLSEAAYVTATTIIGLENVLDAVERWRSTFDRPRGRDPGMYYVRVFGDPAPARRGAGASAVTTSR